MAKNILPLVLAGLVCISLANALPRLPVSWHVDAAAKPVNVTLYYESLCPGCHMFISMSLYPTWKKALGTGLMTVELRPYGNTRETHEGSQYKFDCQHGPNECVGDILESCILHYHSSNTTQQMEIIYCVEMDFYNTKGADWQKTLQTCAHTGVDVNKVSTCTKGPEGNTLQHNMGLNTGPHKYVPWVMLDGKHDDEAAEHLLQRVCAVYTGTPPKICQQLL